MSSEQIDALCDAACDTLVAARDGLEGPGHDLITECLGHPGKEWLLVITYTVPVLAIIEGRKVRQVRLVTGDGTPIPDWCDACAAIIAGVINDDTAGAREVYGRLDAHDRSLVLMYLLRQAGQILRRAEDEGREA